MNAGVARFFLWLFPTLVVAAWGFVSRSAEVPFAVVPLVIFASVFAVGCAARSVPRRSLAIAACVGGVNAALIGPPLAMLAMLPPGATAIGIGFGSDWGNLPPALAWTVFALIMVSAAVAICWSGVLLGTSIRRTR
ncbi:MAG: hypothetical protein WEE89_18865 [Gemmatimonadota bacterium]